MKVFLLAAGLGSRMRPLTNTIPKPLIKVNNKPLIVHTIEKLRDAGFKEFVINCHWLADKLQQALGNGKSLGVSIEWSYEEQLLNTAGGIFHAKSLLGEQPFVLHNSDIWSDYSYQQLHQYQDSTNSRLILVNNPEHHPNGDFSISANHQLTPKSESTNNYTYSGIAVIVMKSILSYPQCRQDFSLVDVWNYQLSQANQIIEAEIHHGYWADIGTVERLEALKQYLNK